MKTDALVLINLRNAFFKRKYYLALSIFFSLLVLIGLLIGVLTYLLNHRGYPIYFVADEVSRIIQDAPVQQPIPVSQVIAWTIPAVEAANSYDYINYRQQLQDAQKYFTEYGWRNYMNTLSASNNLLALTNRQLIITAKVVGEPKLIAQGPLGKFRAYAWKFQMPVLLTYRLPPYQGDKAQFQNALQVSVVVQRQPLLQSYKGLGILQMIQSFVFTPSTSV